MYINDVINELEVYHYAGVNDAISIAEKNAKQNRLFTSIMYVFDHYESYTCKELNMLYDTITSEKVFYIFTKKQQDKIVHSFIEMRSK